MEEIFKKRTLSYSRYMDERRKAEDSRGSADDPNGSLDLFGEEEFDLLAENKGMSTM